MGLTQFLAVHNCILYTHHLQISTNIKIMGKSEKQNSKGVGGESSATSFKESNNLKLILTNKSPSYNNCSEYQQIVVKVPTVYQPKIYTFLYNLVHTYVHFFYYIYKKKWRHLFSHWTSRGKKISQICLIHKVVYKQTFFSFFFSFNTWTCLQVVTIQRDFFKNLQSLE